MKQDLINYGKYKNSSKKREYETYQQAKLNIERSVLEYITSKEDYINSFILEDCKIEIFTGFELNSIYVTIKLEDKPVIKYQFLVDFRDNITSVIKLDNKTSIYECIERMKVI